MAQDPNEELAMAKPRISKRSMKKIKATGGGNGTRRVFDEEGQYPKTETGNGTRRVFEEEGQAVSALAQFGADLDSDEDATPASNAVKLQAKLALRDGDDKEEFRRRQKEAKFKLKEKIRKQLDKDSDDED
ncbi:hypothetical protein T484DRAFT_1810184, partial [Baffinella frigidus]